MKKALFPGSFDPPSLGHLDIIRRGASLVDELIVAVAVHPDKQALFSTEQKMSFLTTLTREIPNVTLLSFEGLVVDFCREHHIQFLLRGLRAFSDFEYEFRMALANRKLTQIETLFLMADPNLAHISSSLIRDIASHDCRLHDFLPAAIEEQVYTAIRRKKNRG